VGVKGRVEGGEGVRRVWMEQYCK